MDHITPIKTSLSIIVPVSPVKFPVGSTRLQKFRQKSQVQHLVWANMELLKQRWNLNASLGNLNASLRWKDREIQRLQIEISRLRMAS